MKNQITFSLLLLVLLSSLGCSGLINRARIKLTTEETLLKAGFKPMPVNQTQAYDVAGFPTGKISSIQRHGTIYYIYPDLKHHQLLMGGQQEFARYHDLITEQLAPPTSSSSNLEHDWAESGAWKN